MKYAFTSLAFGLGASALNVPRTCTFGLSASDSSGNLGSVGQLGDGQNRVLGGYPAASYSINNGQITDAAGRGCILTPPTSQFQCDTGATPSGGFDIGSNGQVTHDGSSIFYACPATSAGESNIYTTPVAGQTKCYQVSLTASGCYSPGKAPSAPASSQKTSTATAFSTATVPHAVTQTVVQTFTTSVKPSTVIQSKASTSAVSVATSTSSSKKSCPADLSGDYQFPHLIIPVSSSSPNTAAGTSYNGEISSTTSSIFNFDIPTSYTGTCSLIFLFPEQKDLETSSYTFSGPGTVDFAQLNTVATQSTTYANQGSVKTDFGVKTVTPGTSTVITSFACPAGQAVSYELSSVGGTSLTYFQDYNPSPIGLYITSC
jgi:hypothetical protein